MFLYVLYRFVCAFIWLNHGYLFRLFVRLFQAVPDVYPTPFCCHSIKYVEREPSAMTTWPKPIHVEFGVAHNGSKMDPRVQLTMPQVQLKLMSQINTKTEIKRINKKCRIHRTENVSKLVGFPYTLHDLTNIQTD